VAVLEKPVELLKRANQPMAVLPSPMLFKSASSPRTVLSLFKQPSWQTARACGESAKQANTNRMRRNARKGARFIEFFNGKVVVFIMREILSCLLSTQQ
jgi:hypothetical protein